jgi:hypothetical protein
VATVQEILSRPAPQWLVPGFLPERGLGELYGESGCGKTFLALDLACAIARGKDWFGRPIPSGGVVYVAAEGTLRNRLMAYLEREDLEAEALDRLIVVEEHINLMDAVSVRYLIEHIRALESRLSPLRIVVFDTLNRCMPGGNENEAKDMGSAIAGAKQIEHELGCLVLLIHHSGKDPSKGSRGHSSLLAALDAQIEVVNGASRTATATKVRDAESGTALGFRLDVVDLGPAPVEGRETSCVVVADEVKASRPRTKKLSAAAQTALRALDVLSADNRLPETSSIPKGARGADLESWRARFLLLYGEKNSSKEAQQTAFRRAKDDLIEAHVIGICDPWVWRWTTYA